MEQDEFLGKSTGGRWVNVRDYARLTGLSTGLLGNWRCQDRKAGFIAPGRPVWRRFAGTVRYWLPAELLCGQPDGSALGCYRPRRRGLPPTAEEVSDARR